MAAHGFTPVILLAFANEQDNRLKYLRELPKELRQLSEILELSKAQGLCELVVRPNATLATILNDFRTHRDQIAVFHYAGHADSYRLLFEAADGEAAAVDAAGFAAFLAEQLGAQLVFLNACSTREQVDQLLEAQVPAVIATAQDIYDAVARDFAIQFYRSLATGAGLRKSYNEASAAVRASRGGPARHLRPTPPKQPESGQLPWEFHVRPGAEQVEQWDLPTAVQNPLFGLPPLPDMDLPPDPFRHLQWFRRQDAPIFFGRGYEIRELYTRINDIKRAPIVLLYGQSGVGKSSLLEAGLLPRLEREFACFYIRRDQQNGLTGSLAERLCARTSHKTVLQAWLDQEAQRNKPLVVILDQVEEVFTRPQPGQPNELAEFLATVQTLFGDRAQRPEGKLVLGFRKEYSAEIVARLTERNLSPEKIFLEPLNERGIIEAVTGVARTPALASHYGLTVDAALPDLIANAMLSDSEAPIAPTLQILLTKMWREATAANATHPIFDAALYRKLERQGIALDNFLQQQIDVLKKSNAEEVDSGLALDILYCHTTSLGTAEQHTRAELEQTYHHRLDVLGSLLQQFQDRYLLIESSADRPAEPSTRLAHDALAPLVRDRFDRSDAPGQRARRILSNRTVDWRDEDERVLLNDEELDFVERNAANMRAWSEDETRLVDASRHARDERARERQRQQAEAEQLRREQAEASERARRIRKTLRQVLVGVMVVTVIATGFVWLRDQNQSNQQLKIEAQRLASLASQQLMQDPVASVNLALRALPKPSDPKPYVPQAEFALNQALDTSLERAYLQIAQPPLRTEQVASGAAYLAVGGDALHLVAFDLSEVITLAGHTEPVAAVAWNDQGDTLLSRDPHSVRIWQKRQQIAIQESTDELYCAAWQPGAAQIALCQANSLWLWNYATDTANEVRAFSNPVANAHWSPDGRWLAAWDEADSSQGQTLAVHDTQLGQLWLQTEITHSERIQALAWSPDSHHLVAAFDNNVLRIWAVDQPGTAVQVTVPVTTEGAIDQILFVDPARFVTGGLGDMARLWSLDGEELQRFGEESDFVQGLEIAPGVGQLLTFENNGLVKLWTLGSDTPSTEFRGHDKRVLSVAWRSGYLATSSIDGTARVWNAATGSEVIALRGHQGGAIAERADVLGVRWLDDHHLLTYGEDGSLRIWQVFDERGLPLCFGGSNAERPQCRVASRRLVGDGAAINFARWLDNETILLTDRDSMARRISLPSGEIQTLRDLSGEYPEVRWDPAGRRVFTYVEESLLFDNSNPNGHVLAFPGGQLIAEIPGPIATAFWLAQGLLISRESGETWLVDAETGQQVFELSGLAAKVTAAQPYDEQRLAVADAAGVIHIWNPQTGEELSRLDNAQQDNLLGPVYELQWSQDGALLLAAGQQVTLWDVDQGVVKWTTDVIAPRVHAAFSPDERMVATTLDNSFFVQDSATSDVLWRNQDHTEPIAGIAWLTARRWPNQDRYGRLLGNLVRWLNGERWHWNGARFLLLTWSGDGTARLWDWEGQVEILRMSSGAPINVAAVSDEGSTLFTADINGALRVRPPRLGDPAALLIQAQQPDRRTRPLSAEQLAEFSLLTP